MPINVKNFINSLNLKSKNSDFQDLELGLFSSSIVFFSFFDQRMGSPGVGMAYQRIGVLLLGITNYRSMDTLIMVG